MNKANENAIRCVAAVEAWLLEHKPDSGLVAYMRLALDDLVILSTFEQLERPATAPWLLLAWADMTEFVLPVSLCNNDTYLISLACLLGTTDRRLTQQEVWKLRRVQLPPLPPKLDPPVTLDNWARWTIWQKLVAYLGTNGVSTYGPYDGAWELERQEKHRRLSALFSLPKSQIVWQWLASSAWPLPNVRKDDDLWHLALACWLNQATPLTSAEAVRTAVVDWKSKQGPQWRRILALEMGSVLLAYVLVTHTQDASCRTSSVFASAQSVLDFKHLGAWKNICIDSHQQGGHFYADPQSAKTLLDVFGSRTLDLLEARYACQPFEPQPVVALGQGAFLPNTTAEPRRQRLSLHDLAAVLKPPYPPCALELLWKHHRTKDWGELVKLADNAQRLEAEGLLDQPLHELLAWYGRQPDLVLSALKPEARERWGRSLTADRGCYPTDLTVQEKLLRGRVLERSDPRGVMLGDFTSCCQHVGGAAAPAAWHGQENPWGGFFVIEELRGRLAPIKAGSWLWLQPDAQGVPVYAVFDSVEVPVQARHRVLRDEAFNHDLTRCLVRAALALYRHFPSLQAVVFGPFAAHIRMNTAVMRPVLDSYQPGMAYVPHYHSDIEFVPYLQKGGAAVHNPDGSRAPGVFLADTRLEGRQLYVSRPSDERLAALEAVIDDPVKLLAALPVHKPREVAYANYV